LQTWHTQLICLADSNLSPIGLSFQYLAGNYESFVGKQELAAVRPGVGWGMNVQIGTVQHPVGIRQSLRSQVPTSGEAGWFFAQIAAALEFIFQNVKEFWNG
jgi:hypothetical protein